jgi:hypothetical protein
MSGGPAIRFSTTGSMEVFGLISSDQETDFVNDRSVSGSAIVALLGAAGGY